MELPNAQDAMMEGKNDEMAEIARDASAALSGQYDDYDDPSPMDRRASLVILSVNDVHDMFPGHGGRGGIAGLATLLDQERAKVPKDATVLVTLNGDFLNGSEIGERLQGAHTIELLDHVGIDFVVLGNHEFDFGEQVLRQRMASSRRFQWLGSNVLDQSSGGQILAGITDTVVLSLHDGLKLGLFGVVTQDTPTTSCPGDNIIFANVVDTAKRCVQALRAQNVDMIVALTHLHVEDDKALARHVPGIHVILGGHDHEPYTLYEGSTLIHKSGQNAKWLARLEFELVYSGRHKDRPLTITSQWSMLKNQHIPAQVACEEIVVKWLRYLATLDHNQPDMHKPLAVLTLPLCTETKLLRSTECNAGQLVADAMQYQLEADVALINGGFIRGDSSYDAGTSITMAMLLHEMPFPRRAVVVKLSVRDFCDAILQHFRFYPQVSSSFPHLSQAIRLTIDCRPSGGTGEHAVILDIHRVGIEGTLTSLDSDATLLVATSEFNAHGGDACSAWLRGEIVQVGERVTQVVAEYLTKIKDVAYPPDQHRITIIE